jgi:transcriptional regulator with XRE-family HTH domain
MDSRDDLEQSHEELRRWTDFGRWLEAARVEQGMTRTQLAAAVHMSVQTLVALEHGGFRRTTDGPWVTPNPKDETLVSLARALGIDPGEMFQRVGRYDDRARTRESLRRASGKLAGRERIEDLERRVADLEEIARQLTEGAEGSLPGASGARPDAPGSASGPHRVRPTGGSGRNPGETTGNPER